MNKSNGAVWVDKDTETQLKSLKSDPILRKLRSNEYEDVISGTTYEDRLRCQ
jgi:hypothetical protein